MPSIKSTGTVTAKPSTVREKLQLAAEAALARVESDEDRAELADYYRRLGIVRPLPK